jgi:hypothetical protein
MSEVVLMKGLRPPKLPIIQIPKVTSRPAFANKPSFLTSLQPELRNQVYEILFKRENPILIYDRDAVLRAREEAAQFTVDMRADGFSYGFSYGDEDLENELTTDGCTAMAFAGDISSNQMAFFLACRQRYTETIGVCLLLTSSAH